MKKIMNKIFFPNKIIGFLLFNISFGLLIYVFATHLEDTPLAYITYLLSTYALIIFICWFCKICKFSNEFIKKTKIYQLYQKHFFLITKTLLLFSSLLNISYSIFNLVVGIYYRSFWFITFAVYYFLLWFMRFFLLYKEKDFNVYNLNQYKKLKRCGIILLLLNVVLVGIIILILHTNQSIHYAGYVIYIVAIYDFYLIISAIFNVFKYRNSNSPILLASKFINLTVAMISMLSLEVAMIEHFGDNDLTFRIVMTGSMGFAICLINSFMAIYMIIKSRKKVIIKDQVSYFK